MSDQPKNNDLEYSRQLQEKFELYLLALIFTLLGLAVQTAKFGANQIADILELLGWSSLLVSGLAGLSRLEWVPVGLKVHSHVMKLKREHDQFVEMAEGGVDEVPVIDQSEPAPIQTLINDRANDIKKYEARVKEVETSTLRKYSLHKWTFVLGLVLLIGARGYVPTSTIVKQHLTIPSSGPEKLTLSPAPEVKR